MSQSNHSIDLECESVNINHDFKFNRFRVDFKVNQEYINHILKLNRFRVER